MSENQSLWGISEEIVKLEELFMKSGGEVTPEIEERQGEIERLLFYKTDGCVEFIKKQKYMIEAAKNRKSDIESYIKARENMVANFEGYIFDCINRSKRKVFNGTMYSIKKRKPKQVLKYENEKFIPERFIEYVPASTKILTNELKSALKTEKIEGVELVDSDAKSIQLGVAK